MMQSMIVYPMGLAKRDYKNWDASIYKAKAFVTRDSCSLKGKLKSLISDLITDKSPTICVIWDITESGLKYIADNFPSAVKTILEPKDYMKCIGIPGAVVISSTDKECITGLVMSWGSLDGIQILLPYYGAEGRLFHYVSRTKYVYTKRNLFVWNEVMEFAAIVITDTGFGNEFEIVYPKNSQMNDIINSHLSNSL